MSNKCFFFKLRNPGTVPGTRVPRILAVPMSSHGTQIPGTLGTGTKIVGTVPGVSALGLKSQGQKSLGLAVPSHAHPWLLFILPVRFWSFETFRCFLVGCRVFCERKFYENSVMLDWWFFDFANQINSELQIICCFTYFWRFNPGASALRNTGGARCWQQLPFSTFKLNFERHRSDSDKRFFS